MKSKGKTKLLAIAAAVALLAAIAIPTLATGGITRVEGKNNIFLGVGQPDYVILKDAASEIAIWLPTEADNQGWQYYRNQIIDNYGNMGWVPSSASAYKFFYGSNTFTFAQNGKVVRVVQEAGGWYARASSGTISNTIWIPGEAPDTEPEASGGMSGSLKITKTFPDGFIANPRFVVTGTGYQKTINYDEFMDGVYTIDSLPVGIYNVNEIGGAISGYAQGVSYTVDGVAVAEGSIAEVTVMFGETAEVIIANTYEPTVYGSVVFTKTITGRLTNETVDPDKEFKFTLTSTGGYTEEFTLSGNDGWVWRNELPVGDYTITENTSGAQISPYGLSITGNGQISFSVEENVETSETMNNNYYDAYVPPEETTSPSPTPTEEEEDDDDDTPPIEEEGDENDEDEDDGDDDDDIPPPPPPPQPPPPPPPYTSGGTDQTLPPLPMVPGGELIMDGDGWIELDDEGVPLGRWDWDDEEDMWIFDEFPPLGEFQPSEMPQTGIESNLDLWIFGMIASLMALGILCINIGIMNKKEREVVAWHNARGVGRMMKK